MTDDALDRRLIRCRCRHSLESHPAPSVLCAGPGWCKQCQCTRFSERPAPWRVVLAPVGAQSSVFDVVWRTWMLVSPRGEHIYHLSSHAGAVTLARHMAGVDEMLARVKRLERNTFGDHPSLRAPARNAVDVPTLIGGPVRSLRAALRGEQ